MGDPDRSAGLAVAIDTGSGGEPLLEGVHRFRLDPVRAKEKFVRDASVRIQLLFMIAGIVLILRVLHFAFLGASLWLLGVVSLLWIFATWRMQTPIMAAHEAHVASCNVLLSESAARANPTGAEILRANVEKIYETSAGLWLTDAKGGPNTFVFVTKEIERYEEARACLAEWAPIEESASSRAMRLIEYLYGRGYGVLKEPLQVEDAPSRQALETLRRSSPREGAAARTRLVSQRRWRGWLISGYVLFLAFVCYVRLF